MPSWRSVLYVPGVQERMLAKAASLGADGIILDLEASVPSGEKLRARELASRAVPAIAANTAADLFVRVNTLASGLVADDLAAIVQPGLDGIVLPATDRVDDLRQVASWLVSAERDQHLPIGSLRVLVILETARGVVRALEILEADPRVAAVLFGAEDFRQDMDVPRTADGHELQYARAAVALAARAARVPALDTVYTDVANEVGLIEEMRRSQLLGYSGKQVIHPRQIEPVHRALAPTVEQVEWARRIVAEGERAAAAGIGAFLLEGQMIDRPVIAQAEQILARARQP